MGGGAGQELEHRQWRKRASEKNEGGDQTEK
jgi:hypothetical protein